MNEPSWTLAEVQQASDLMTAASNVIRDIADIVAIRVEPGPRQSYVITVTAYPHRTDPA